MSLCDDLSHFVPQKPVSNQGQPARKRTKVESVSVTHLCRAIYITVVYVRCVRLDLAPGGQGLHF